MFTKPTTPKTLSYKVIICGPEQSGKTSYLTRIIHGETPKYHVPTLGVEVHPFIVQAKLGCGVHQEIRFDCWDVAGDRRNHGLGDGYFENAKAAIIMFRESDLTGSEKWLAKLPRNIPIYTCFTKAKGVRSAYVRSEGLTVLQEGFGYLNMGEYTLEPFAYLASKLLGIDCTLDRPDPAEGTVAAKLASPLSGLSTVSVTPKPEREQTLELAAAFERGRKAGRREALLEVQSLIEDIASGN